jgi:hypothetical protein
MNQEREDKVVHVLTIILIVVMTLAFLGMLFGVVLF